jgi:hypothetical protein
VDLPVNFMPAKSRNGRNTSHKPQTGARLINIPHKVLARIGSGRPVDENA